MVSRITLFDRIKVVMKVFIVVTHVALITDAMRAAWLFPLWIDQAVPFFWMISAYLFARAADAHGSEGVVDELRWSRLWPRLRRVLVPYTVVYLGILALMVRRGALLSAANALVGWEVAGGAGLQSSVKALAVTYVCGSPGPGGYYIPCLFQMYLVLPFMWFALRRRPAFAVLAVVAATGSYEVLAIHGLVSSQAYRLVIVRYLPFLLLGMALHRWRASGALAPSNRKCVIVAPASLAVGAAYIIGVSYLGFPALGVSDWAATNTFSILYSGAAFSLMLVVSSAVSEGHAAVRGSASRVWLDGVIEQLSKAALHVYVFQMFWYYLVNAHVGIMSAIPLPLLIAVDVVACVGVGYGMYVVESGLKRSIAQR